jgi:hypothetical protein
LLKRLADLNTFAAGIDFHGSIDIELIKRDRL